MAVSPRKQAPSTVKTAFSRHVESCRAAASCNALCMLAIVVFLRPRKDELFKGCCARCYLCEIHLSGAQVQGIGRRTPSNRHLERQLDVTRKRVELRFPVQLLEFPIGRFQFALGRTMPYEIRKCRAEQLASEAGGGNLMMVESLLLLLLLLLLTLSPRSKLLQLNLPTNRREQRSTSLCADKCAAT